jgi:hypothetical protein
MSNVFPPHLILSASLAPPCVSHHSSCVDPSSSGFSEVPVLQLRKPVMSASQARHLSGAAAGQTSLNNGGDCFFLLSHLLSADKTHPGAKSLQSRDVLESFTRGEHSQAKYLPWNALFVHKKRSYLLCIGIRGLLRFSCAWVVFCRSDLFPVPFFVVESLHYFFLCSRSWAAFPRALAHLAVSRGWRVAGLPCDIAGKIGFHARHSTNTLSKRA